ncbi:MAG: cupin, partial [Planctomycetota bacterium]|nr:cupin [Planctomycetota bacterium]
MANKPALIEEMRSRTAFFEDLRPSQQAFVDTRIPEHERDIYNVIGRGVTEDSNLQPAIRAVEGFNVTYIGADPGKGAALHSHPTVEVFVAMTGRWVVYWGNHGDDET